MNIPELINEYGWAITAIIVLLLALVFVFYLYMRSQFRGVNSHTDTRIDGLEKNTDKGIKELKELFARHEQQCNERHQQFIDYMERPRGQNIARGRQTGREATANHLSTL